MQVSFIFNDFIRNLHLVIYANSNVLAYTQLYGISLLIF